MANFVGGAPMEQIGDEPAGGTPGAAYLHLFTNETIDGVEYNFVPTVQGAGIPWVGSSPSGAAETGATNAYFFSSGFIGLLAAEAVYSKAQGYKNVTLIGSPSARTSCRRASVNPRTACLLVAYIP